MTLLTIGEVATRSGLATSALRYYDDLGILTAARLPNGHRRYPVEALERLQLVKLCQALGCSLDEIASLLGPHGGAGRREVAARKLHELESTLARLGTIRSVLRHLAHCEHTEEQGDQCRADIRSACTTLTP